MASTKSTLPALLLTLLLTACGGGGSDTTEPPASAQSINAACTVVKIATFGDSTMEGEPHRAAMQGAVDQILGAGRTAIENRAASGTAAFQLRAGADGRNLPWAQQLAATRPDVVLINHAINDMTQKRSLDEYRADLVALVTQAQAAGATVVLQTPIPQSLMAPFGQPWRVDAIKEYARVMREVAVARGASVAEVSDFVESLPNYGQRVYDGIHPDADLIVRVYSGPTADAIAAASRGKCGISPA